MNGLPGKSKARKGGKNNRKHGRNKKKPSNVRYTNERRWEKNKIKKAQRYANKFNRVVIVKVKGLPITIKPSV